MFDPNTVVSMLVLGLVAGVLGGLFGIGGGLVIVPALVIWKGLDQKTATGTSLFALMWPVGILGVIEYYRRGEMRFDLGTWIAVGLVLGILVGAKLTAPLSPASMKRAYGIFLLVVGVYYLWGFQPRPQSAGAAPPPAAKR
jgi:uncharacterized membrane protein YfcA